MRDVIVIGAGPAGARAAAGLARSGHDVLILEEHEQVGRPVHCTGLVGAEAFDEFGLPQSLILARARSARFWGATGPSVPLAGRHIDAAIIDRAALDQHLISRAVLAGASLEAGARVQSVDVDEAGVSLHVTDQRQFRARAVVLACGAQYRFHRPLGLGLPRRHLQTAQVETPFPAAHEIEVRLGRDLAPAGFAWVVPFTRDGASFARLGLMSRDAGARRFDMFLEALCRRTGLRREDVPRPRVKMLPLGPVDRSYAARVIAVGDAAGLVKPTTGGGIYYGMLSGDLASDVLGDALTKDALDSRTLSAYERAWRKRLGSEIRTGLVFRRLAERLSDDAIDSLIDLARIDGVAPLLYETASFNWHQRAAVALLGHREVRRILFRSWLQRASEN